MMGATTLRTVWRLTALLAILVTGALGQASFQGKAAPRYKIVELPLRPTSISDSEWVAGTADDQHAAIWSSKTGMSRVPLPHEFSFSECSSINSQGDAVGTASTGDYSRRVGFVFKAGRLSLLAGQQSRANSINEAGGIVGQTIIPGTKVAGPVLWKDGSPLDLGICCSASAKYINRRNTVAGDAYDKQGRYHAFVWDADHGAGLVSAPGEEYSSALALNNQGDILVRVVPGGLFLASGGRLQPLDLAKATARAMNDHGVLVGSHGSNPEAQRAFVWDKAQGLRDLNTLIPPGSDWTLEVASSINDRGEIVGWGDHGGTENAGFLLQPILSKDRSHQPHHPVRK